MTRYRSKFRRVTMFSLVFIGVCVYYRTPNQIRVDPNQWVGLRTLKTIQKENGFETADTAMKSKQLIHRDTPEVNIIPIVPKEIQDVAKELGFYRPILTLFTSWTEEKGRYRVHNLTINNWLSLRPYVIPVVFTNDHVIASECLRQNWNVLPIRVGVAGGIPVLKFMFQDAISTYNTMFYGYSNSDILYTNTLIKTLAWVLNSSVQLESPVMIIGKRTNVDNVIQNDMSSWKKLGAVASKRGRLFTGLAEDYFLATRTYPWKDIPEVVIGRPAYDNFLVYHARTQKHIVIDASKTILAVHQTTKAGNDEGRSRNNARYNYEVLEKLYQKLNYRTGTVECANYKTIEVDKTISVVKRKIPRYCRIFGPNVHNRSSK